MQWCDFPLFYFYNSIMEEVNAFVYTGGSKKYCDAMCKTV